MILMISSSGGDGGSDVGNGGSGGDGGSSTGNDDTCMHIHVSILS